MVLTGKKFRFDQEFIGKYDGNSNDGYILEVAVKYPEKLHDLYSNLLFLPERMETKKYEKLVCTLCHTHKSPEPGFESWNGTSKSTLSTRIQSRSMAETIH